MQYQQRIRCFPNNNIINTMKHDSITSFYLIELEEVATLLMISIDELRSALLYRTYSVSCSGMDPHGMGGVSGGNCFSRDSTLPSANSRTYIGNNHQQHQQMLLQQQRTSLLSTSASMVGASMVGRGTTLSRLLIRTIFFINSFSSCKMF
jgi:hypothetical protein